MRQIWKYLIITTATLVVVIGAIYFWKVQQSVMIDSGYIEGFIEEPGRGFCEGTTNQQELINCGTNIKPLLLDSDMCAESINSKKLYCVFQKEFGKYNLQVPAGNYYVFLKDKNGHRNYHNEFTVCGRTESCTSFKRAVVEVLRNKTTVKIDIYKTDQDE